MINNPFFTNNQNEVKPLDFDNLENQTVNDILTPNYNIATKFFISYWGWNKKRFKVSDSNWEVERHERSGDWWGNTYSIKPNIWNIEEVSIIKGWWLRDWWWSYTSLWSIIFSNWWSIEWNEWNWDESNDRIILKKDEIQYNLELDENNQIKLYKRHNLPWMPSVWDSIELDDDIIDWLNSSIELFNYELNEIPTKISWNK